MGAFDHLLTDDPAAPPAASGGAFDHLLSTVDEPKSGGAFAAKEIPREMEIRAEALKKLAETHGTPGYLDRAVDQYTMGLIRPISGLKTLVEGKANEWLGDGKPATAGEYWRGGVGAQDQFIKQAEANTPGPAGTAVDIAGGLASGSGGPKILGRGALAGQAFLQGAIGGASRNAEDVGSAAKGAAIGGTVDAAAQSTLGGLMDRFLRGTRKELGVASRGGNAQQMQAEGGALLDKLDNAGIHFSGTETPKLANGVNAATSGPLPASVRGEIDEVVQDVNRRVQNGAMTFGDVRVIQSEISKLKAHTSSDVRRVAGEMSDAVDHFFNTAKPTMPASSVGKVGPDDLVEARRLYATGKQSGRLEGKAEVAAGANDPATATASTFKKYSDNFTANPDKLNPNTPEQRRLIDVIAAGDPKTAAAAKGLDRWGNNLLGYGSAGAAAGIGLPYLAGGDSTGAGGVSSTAGLTAMAAGLAAKGGGRGLRQMLAEKSAERVNDLLRNVATGKTAPDPNAYIPRDLLAKILMKQNLAQGAGNYASSFTNAGNPQP